MKWKECIVHTTNEAVEPVANLLNELGANGVVIDDPSVLTRKKRAKFGEIYELNPNKYPEEGIYVKAYFPDNDEWDRKENEIIEQINKLSNIGIDVGPLNIWTKIVQEEDWENEWKKYFKPIKVTNRFVIIPTWEQYVQNDPNELLIKIDPGMAFGTGTHPTTVLSLAALEQYVKEKDIVIDVGSGSGILSIAACQLGAEKVYSFDLDEIAVTSTIRNRDLNNLTEKVIVQQNDLLKNVQHKANIIVSNILADIIIRFIDDAWENLLVDGYFITSGIITEKQQMVESKLKDVGFSIEKVNTDGHWVSIIAKK